jgi:tRNA U34 2-thiouridine synthase MnmA/TrmU
MRNWDPLLSEEQDIDWLGEDTVGGKGGVALKYGRGTAAAGPSGQHQCEWERDWNDVLRVTKHIGLGEKNVRLVDFTKDYWSRVFEPAVGVWQNGGTPNPDISCNR